MVITMHICRGNFRSTWFTSGGYEPVAKTLFGNCKVDGFFLEYDSERAGGFEPLRYIQDQKVILGLVTSKEAKLENKEEIIKRIHEAEKYVPLNQLALSPQCGFASTEKETYLPKRNNGIRSNLLKKLQKKYGNKKKELSFFFYLHIFSKISAVIEKVVVTFSIIVFSSILSSFKRATIFLRSSLRALSIASFIKFSNISNKLISLLD